MWFGLPFTLILFIHVSVTTNISPMRFVGPDCFFYSLNSSKPVEFSPLEHITCEWSYNQSATIHQVFDDLNCTTSPSACFNKSVVTAPAAEVEPYALWAVTYKSHIFLLHFLPGVVITFLFYLPMIYLMHKSAKILATKGVIVQFQLQRGPFGGNPPTTRVESHDPSMLPDDASEEEQALAEKPPSGPRFVPRDQIITGYFDEDVLLRKLGLNS